jgi:hypothetical protein
LIISTSSSSNYNAIDPNLVITPSGSWYLSLGSFWTGIKLVQIDSTGALKSSAITSLAQRTADGGAIEVSAASSIVTVIINYITGIGYLSIWFILLPLYQLGQML